MQCVCENPMIVNAGKDANFNERELVSVKTKSLGILPVYEVWEVNCFID